MKYKMWKRFTRGDWTHFGGQKWKSIRKFVGACRNVNFGGIIDNYSPARDLQRKKIS